jgi:glutamate dehydrogenase (NAD(P)+)
MDAPLTKIMTTDLVSTEPDTSILNCIRMLENHEFSAMPVVDENRVLGIISGDILARKTLFRLLQTED